MTKPSKAVAPSENAAIAAERLRVAAILESAEGKRNPAMAQKLALYSVLDAETAIGILADAPSANPYLEAMSKEGPIGLGGAAVEVSNDPKAARLRELGQSVAAFNAEKGWTKPTK
ncbi:hypothetical protein SAMN05216330_102100 [Bradyrhizobium sp. Ghvi]|uniref:hypothetical protein n=1 Tax=Bradyrhizobium sp. Ghvi TaxID=1855319 RepID=UPI0008E001F3|nr:hypothetical protein [Bradyrhizobium sp. Ghvi]SFO17881.1 hypothetical protein SAMN05216330_102100 [Bradyrhizobium sp. Ghvi]